MSLSRMLRSIDDYFHRLTKIKSVLFEAMNGFGFNCQAPIIDALCENPHIKIGITTSGLGDEELTRQHIAHSGYSQFFIEPKKAAWEKWDLVICTDTQGVWHKRNHKTAYLQHGISGRGNYPYDGKTNIHDSNERFDYFFASSKNIAKKCTRYFPQLDENVDARIVGFPLLDQAFNTDTQMSNISLNPNKRTILFTSHWDEHSLLKSIGDEVLDLLSNLNDYNILLRAHPYNWDIEEELFSQKKDWREKLQSFASHKDIQFLPDIDIVQLICAADILISDHNSSSLEFCALNKPVIYFNNPKYLFHDVELINHITNATYQFTTVKELEHILLGDISTETHQQNRKELASYCYSNLGNASETAAKEIVTICG